MGKKSKKHRKLKVTAIWIDVLIEFGVGAQLKHVAGMDTNFAMQIVSAIRKCVKEIFASRDWTDEPENFIEDCKVSARVLFEEMLNKYMKTALKKGFPEPEKPTILTPPSKIIQ